MVKLMIFLVAVLAVIRCSDAGVSPKDPKATDTASAATATLPGAEAKNSTALRLSYFEAIPDTLDGCSELFTYDTTVVANDKFIFLSNIAEFAIIRVEGKDVYLQKDTSKSRTANDSVYVAVYSGGGYEAILSVKELSHSDEVGYYSGTLQIRKGDLQTTIKVHGETGC